MRRRRVRRPTFPLEEARSTLVSEIMTADPVTVRSEAALEEVVALLCEHDFGQIPVVDEAGHAIGMISRADSARGTLAANDRARDIMTPIALWAPESASIAEAAHVLTTSHLHAVVVTNKAGNIVGILTALDIVRWVAGIECV